MKEGEKFLSGTLDIGIMQIPITVFPNTKKKEGSNQPDRNIVVTRTNEKGEKKSVIVGALWVRTKKAKKQHDGDETFI